MSTKIFLIILITVTLLGLGILYTINLVIDPESTVPKRMPQHPQTAVFCGGIANIQCPAGQRCVVDGNYPDAGGTCR